MVTVVNSFKKVAEVFGIKANTRTYIPPKEGVTKFVKCPNCGGEMKYIRETNVMCCSNKVKFNDKNDEGKIIKTRLVDCNTVRLLASDGVKFATSAKL